MSFTLDYVAAVFAGAASWAFLHRRTVRGDLAFTFYLTSTVILYLSLRCFPGHWQNPLCSAAALVSVHFLVLAAITIIYRLSPWHPLASYPGPIWARISSLWLTYISSTGKRHLILDRLHEEYGPFVRIGPNAVEINSSSAISIYNSFEKAESYRYPAHDNLTSVFLKNDSREKHKERRRVWGGMLTPTGMAELTPALERRTWHLMRCIERRQSAGDGYVDLGEAFYHFAYDLGGDIIFGACNKIELMRDGDVKGLVNTGKFTTGMMDTFGHSPWLLDILWRIPAGENMHQLVRMADEMTHNRVNSDKLSASKDLLSYLMEGGVPMCELERDAAVAMLAASENTAMTFAIALYYLTAEPKYYKVLQAQLDQLFSDALGPLSASALATIPFLDGVLNEALRLGTTFFLPRITPPEGTEVDGKYIPGNTVVALAAYTQQTSPENFFPEPMNFRPERWLPQGLGPDTKTNRSALASFSYGQHACLGKTLAFQQMRYVVARLVLAFDTEFKPGFDPQAFREGILGMGTPHLEVPLLVRFVRRPGIHLEHVSDVA
ncbi:hypothetical protein ONZ51_g4582 [Trametes cubensis]|uniref:Cytochrome P450 n=1 Tax=Trametes cubensis TaxID=1111947 RepID=A0AAD7TW31_9APHY|nr:hypothetical protein ONZ51_g4582 [Trametes cubensis]